MTRTPPRRLRARSACVLAALLLGACSGSGERAAPAAGTSPPTDPPASAPAPTGAPPSGEPTGEPAVGPSAAPPAPPPATTWTAGPAEVLPEAKEVATHTVEVLTTYDVGAAGDTVAAVTSDPSRQDATRLAAAPLLDAERWSRGRVVYAQLGGFREERASVMVVVEQRTAGAGAEPATVTRTVDVRVLRRDGRWHFDALAAVGGMPVGRPSDLPAVATAVLDDPRIVLPDSTRWDIHAGIVDPTLLRVMSRIAERTPYTVVTITSGHPRRVFGTEKVSDHTRGRAVDIALLDGTPVVEVRHEGSPAHTLTRQLWEDPDVRQIGSPWALDGYGGRSFTDLVHQDHLHVSVVPSAPEER